MCDLSFFMDFRIGTVKVLNSSGGRMENRYEQ